MSSFDYHVHCDELTYEPTDADLAEYAAWLEELDNGRRNAWQDAEDALQQDEYDIPYEDDGQPDEMQEWHDFDPDC